MSDEESRRQMSKEFLLAEFAMLQARLSDFESLKASRVNFLLIIVAAVVATVPAIADRLQPYFAEAALAVGAILLLLGITTLFRAVEYSISAAVVMRRAGRIRRWFVEQDRSIAPYLAFPPSDDQPAILLKTQSLGWRGGEGVLLIVNGLAAAAIGASAAFLVCSRLLSVQLDALVYVLVSGAGFAAAWFAQIGWLQRRLRRAEQREGRAIHARLTPETRALYSGEELSDT